MVLDSALYPILISDAETWMRFAIEMAEFAVLVWALAWPIMSQFRSCVREVRRWPPLRLVTIKLVGGVTAQTSSVGEGTEGGPCGSGIPSPATSAGGD